MVGGPGRSAAATRPWVPEGQEVIWIDCNPQAGRQMRDMHPFLVLSPRAFSDRTSLVIGFSMTTAETNADNPFAVARGPAVGRRAGKTSYILCHQPKSFDWRTRRASSHPLRQLPDPLFLEAPRRLDQIIALSDA